MTIKEKRKQITDLIVKAFNLLDRTGENAKKYIEEVGKLNDEQWDKYMKSFLKDNEDNFYLEILPNKNEPTLEDLQKAGKALNIPLDEYIYYRDNEGNPVRSAAKVPVGYLTIKCMEQKLMKKNTYSLDISSRNSKTGALTGHDKIARVTDAETYMLSMLGADAMLEEMLSPRADNSERKSEMYKLIGQNGYVYLKDIPNVNEKTGEIIKGQAVKATKAYMLSAMLDNDL